jgi:hypothetical protein
MVRILALLLVLIPSAVQASALVCLFKPLSLRFNLISKNGDDMIQWESSGFQVVDAEFKEPYLTVKHYASSATFKAVIDVNKMQGYGGISTFKGEKSEGEIICALD